MPSLPSLHEVAELASRLDPRPSARRSRRGLTTAQILAIVLSLGALAVIAGVVASRKRSRPGPPAESNQTDRSTGRAAVAV